MLVITRREAEEIDRKRKQAQLQRQREWDEAAEERLRSEKERLQQKWRKLKDDLRIAMAKNQEKYSEGVELEEESRRLMLNTLLISVPGFIVLAIILDSEPMFESNFLSYFCFSVCSVWGIIASVKWIEWLIIDTRLASWRSKKVEIDNHQDWRQSAEIPKISNEINIIDLRIKKIEEEIADLENKS